MRHTRTKHPPAHPVLFLTQPFYVGGGEVVLGNIAEALLHKRSFRPHIVLFQRGPVSTYFKHKRLPVEIVPMRTWRQDGKRLIRYVRTQRIALIHTNTIINSEGALAARACGIPHVWHIHGLPSPCPPPLARRAALLLLGDLSDRLLFCSRFVQKEYTRFGITGHAAILPNGVPLPSRFPSRESFLTRYRIPQNAFVIGTIARIDSQKNIEGLIGAAALLRTAAPEVRCLLLTQDTKTPYAQRVKAANKQAGNPVTFINTFMSDTLPFVSAIDAFLLPSEREGSPLSLLEAMACGKPVIAVQSGGIPEIVSKKTGILVPRGTPSSLARAILILAGNRRSAQRKGAQGRVHARTNHTISRTVTLLERYYYKLLKEKNR